MVLPASAQLPKINTLFPIGGRAGTTAEVEVRGSALAGADKLLVDGRGVTGVVEPGAGKADEKYKPLWQSKCSLCHELRSPANRSMTAAQWAATVERMVKVRQAPLSADEQAKVTEYLQGLARAGKLTAKLTVSKDVQPGLYEVRLVTPRGVSTAGLFEVGSLPEVLGVNGRLDAPQQVTLPCVANGTLAGNAERHYYKFAAKKGQRLVFNLKGFRYNEANQMFFNPDLRLYDASGKEIVENHGYYELDPLLDWTCPADGDYTLEVRDLLGRGNPGSVYRLTMGPVPYDTALYPAAAQPGAKAQVTVDGKNVVGPMACAVDAPMEPGMATVSTPVGPQPLFVTPYPVVSDEQASKQVVKLPAAFAGRVAKAGQPDRLYFSGEGEYEFEVAGPKLGSPIAPEVRLLNAKGRPIARVNGEGRMTAKLDPKQSYSLEVADANGAGGPQYVYVVEARPAKPTLECVARPDAITVRPGMSTAIEVVLTRRERVDGDVTATIEGLPAGVTAKPAVIPPDRGEGWIIVSAAPGAAQASQPVRVVVTGHGPGGEARAEAQPQETYLLNNSPRYIDRTECVLAVSGEPDFTASLEQTEPLMANPRKGTPLKVRIERKPSFKGPVLVRVYGLPSGWVASPETCPADKSEVTVTVRPDGNNTQPFMKRDPKLSPIVAMVEVVADDFPFVAGTLPVTHPDKLPPEPDQP